MEFDVGEVVNLNQARKQRERALKEKRADENRARHGQSKAEKSSISSKLDQLRRALDGSKMDTPEGQKPPSDKSPA